MSYRYKAYLQLLLVSAIWGFAGPVIKFTLRELSPLVFLFYRFAIAGTFAILTLPFFRIKISPKVLLYSFLTSTIGLGLLFLGYSLTSSIEGALISAIGPLLTATAGVMFLREHVTAREKLGIAIALIGTLIIVFEPLANGTITSSLLGNLLVAASVLVGVVLAIMAKVLLRQQSNSAFALTQLSFAVGLLTTLPIVLLVYSPANIMDQIRVISFHTHLGVWYMAFASGTLAYSLWHKAQKTIEVGETALFVYTYPLFAAPLSFLWLKETVSPLFWLGTAITALGILVAELKSPRLNSRR
ncbi:MAG: hypothetical protein UW73_C0027G0003 [Microgenomates group bacterium GW2011_GWB1_44_8]|nr:MAG: hypothetical protein UW73_C0027G0003 [Microgenomates group bacterium GW2011_GWB1_44_8]